MKLRRAYAKPALVAGPRLGAIAAVLPLSGDNKG